MDYNKLINIKNADRLPEIINVINKEKEAVENVNGSFNALCKYMANNIKVELNKLRIRSAIVDLNSIGIDHVFLLAEYENEGLKRLIIDPTFSQFTIGKKTFNENKEIIEKLIYDGYLFIDNDIFNKYLQIFNKSVPYKLIDEYMYEDLRIDHSKSK